MKPPEKEKLINEMINKELSFVGKTIDDVKNDPDWFTNNTMNDNQYQEWKNYCINIMRKQFKMTKKRAEAEFAWFDLSYGLKVKN
jgi:hypothetical protein